MSRKALHQLCHSPIRRDIQRMLETKGETGTHGCMLKLASDRAFHLWHQLERGEISREMRVTGAKPVRPEMRERFLVLLRHPSRTKKTRGTAKDTLRQWDYLWTYLEHEAAVPTNNEAERAIRKAVLWRMVSFGVESEYGATFRGTDAEPAQAMTASLAGAPASAFRA